MSRDKTVCVDFDDTILGWGAENPYPGISKAMRNLEDAGYRIVILTSRLTDEWFSHYKVFGYRNASEFATSQLSFIMDILDSNNIPWDRITSEKVPAIAYFDDRAITVSEEYPLTKAIEDFLK